jgi:hypothetical protein
MVFSGLQARTPPRDGDPPVAHARARVGPPAVSVVTSEQRPPVIAVFVMRCIPARPDVGGVLPLCRPVVRRRHGGAPLLRVPVPAPSVSKPLDRWAHAERLGFDVLRNVDTVVEPDRHKTTLFDGPTTLAAMAL